MADYLWIDDKLFERPWFFRLPPDLKLAYIYIYRNSRPAGIWEIFAEKLTADLSLQKTVSIIELVRYCNGNDLVQTDESKVLEILPGNTHLWIVDFCTFQYPPTVDNPRGLNPDNKAHTGVFRALNRWQLMERVNRQYERIYQTLAVDRSIFKMPPDSAEAFEQFWASYPRWCLHRNRAAAEKIWNKHVGKNVGMLLPEILAALEWQKKRDCWSKKNARFIEAPAVWLNQHRWKTERPNTEHDDDHKKGF